MCSFSVVGTFHAENVDLVLLEEQRIALSSIDRQMLRLTVTKKQFDAIEGIQNMLDAWSDGEYLRGEQEDDYSG